MSYEISADHTQQFLLPPSLDEWVNEEHPVRFIRDFVNQLDLEELGFQCRKSVQGRPNYSSELLLSIWLYGYFEKIRSSRKLEHACRTHMPLIWLTGMHYPDHNSLWRFWRTNGKAIEGVFRQSIKIAQRLDLVGMVLHALDGTKIRVYSSTEKVFRRSELEDFYAAIDESINMMNEAIRSEELQKQSSVNLPELLQDAKKRRMAIKSALAKLDEEKQKNILPAEKDARLMKTKGRIDWAYNAQAVVDDKCGIIVAQEVTNHASDNKRLASMLEEVESNTGGKAAHTVADAGYRGIQQQVQMHDKGHKVILPEHGRESDTGNPYHKSKFIYDEHEDCYYCPQGKKLKYSHTLPVRDNRPEARVYRCRECKQCPVKSQCTRARFGRTVNRDAYELFREKQKELRNKPEIKRLLSRRKAIIEPLFGHIKENLGFRRWEARGLENARSQWSMLCLTTNLKKMYLHWKKQKKIKLKNKLNICLNRYYDAFFAYKKFIFNCSQFYSAYSK